MSSPEQEAILEDWDAILRRPGMNVLATFLTNRLTYTRKQLESSDAAPSYDKVCEFRGKMQGLREVSGFIKEQYDRAAKSDTPEKEK